MSVQITEKERRQRKMWLFMPLIVCPLLCWTFNSLGGGRGGDKRDANKLRKGLNMSLPAARLDEQGKLKDKRGYYKKADQDSVRLMERRKQDPFYNRALAAGGVGFFPGQAETLGLVSRDTMWRTRLGLGKGVVENGFHVPSGGFGNGEGLPVGIDGLRSPIGSAPFMGASTAAPSASLSADGQAGELLRKLDLLKGVLNRQVEGRDSAWRLVRGVGKKMGEGLERTGGFGEKAGWSDRGEDAGIGKRSNGWMVEGRRPVADTQGDPDLDKLSVILDKILRIKYPDESRLVDSGLPVTRDSVLLVNKMIGGELVSTMPGTSAAVSDSGRLLDAGVKKPGPDRGSAIGVENPGTGFIELDEEVSVRSVGEELFAAVVARDQTVVPGESVEFRLMQDVSINSVRIPSGTLLSGKVSLSGERMLVTVSSILVGHSATPVALEVVDLDGLAGIRERGSINRDVAKESAGEAVSGVGLTTVDAGIGMQAMTAGMQAAKTMVGRKVRLVRMTVRAGYKVLLRNTKGNH